MISNGVSFRLRNVRLVTSRYADSIQAQNASARIQAPAVLLDSNADGLLNRDELMQFVGLAADLERPLSLGRGAQSGVANLGNSAAPQYRLRRKLDGGYKLYIGENEIDFRRNNRSPKRADDAPRLSDYDQDANGALDEKELPASLGSLSAVDVDRNGKVSAKELETTPGSASRARGYSTGAYRLRRRA